MKKICPICGRMIKPLGWASHRAKHYRERENKKKEEMNPKGRKK